MQSIHISLSDRKVKYEITADPINTETSENPGSIEATPHRHIRQKCHSRIGETSSNGTPAVISETIVPSSTKLKVRTDRSAMVLVTIVILFVLTHSYRIALKVYEVASPNAHTIEKFKICFALKR